MLSFHSILRAAALRAVISYGWLRIRLSGTDWVRNLCAGYTKTGANKLTELEYPKTWLELKKKHSQDITTCNLSAHLSNMSGHISGIIWGIGCMRPAAYIYCLNWASAACQLVALVQKLISCWPQGLTTFDSRFQSNQSLYIFFQPSFVMERLNLQIDRLVLKRLWLS